MKMKMKFYLQICLLILSLPAQATSGDDFLNNFAGKWESLGAAMTPGTRGTVQVWIDGLQAGTEATRFAATAVCSYIDRNGTSVGWTVTSDWDSEKLFLAPDGVISKNCFGQPVSMGHGGADTASINTISCWHHRDGKQADNIKFEKLNSTETSVTITHRDGTVCSGKVIKN